MSLHELSARQLSQGLQAGRWSSVELTSHFLQRIAEENARVHAVVGLEPAEALRQAEESDRRRAAGKSLGAIDGIPMTIKDAFRVQGYRSTYGFWMFRNYRPGTDSRVVAALRGSGAVILGRSAVPTGSFDWNCRNQIHPECVNPYDATRTPGGSSGGAAAALATGMTPLELGSDFFGSLRYPAHCCGVYSLRTTDGWLPIEDWGPEGFATTVKHIATCGPMARNPGDLQLLLAALEQIVPLPLDSSKSVASRKLRIAYSKALLGIVPEQETIKLFDQMLFRLSTQGHEMIEITPALDWEGLECDFGMIGGHEFANALPRLLRNRMVKRLYARFVLQTRLGHGPFLTHFRLGMLAGKAEYSAALLRREHVFAKVAQFFSQHDLWILPTSPEAAIPRISCGKGIPTPNGKIPYLRYLGAYLGATAMMGTPVLAAPIGLDQRGLPIGVQIHGPRFSDAALVEVVQQLLPECHL